MTRHRRRSWIKLWTTGWLHGSIRWQLTADERGVWADLLAFAGECGQEGEISDNSGRALPRNFIANQFNISQTLLDRTLAKCKHDGRIEEEEREGIIKIANWGHYQSEYERQKIWRKDRVEKPLTDFDAFVEDKRKEYPQLDIDHELERFNLYWSEGNRHLKRPKFAFKNWLDKAGKLNGGSAKPISKTAGPIKEEEHERFFDEEGGSYYVDVTGMHIYGA